METKYHELSFSNFFHTILKHSKGGTKNKAPLFEKMMGWSGLKVSSAQSLSPYINGKRSMQPSYGDIIIQDGVFEQAKEYIEKNLIPYLTDVENTVADLSLLLIADKSINEKTRQEIFSMYTEPALLITHMLYYSITCANNTDVTVSPNVAVFGLNLIAPGISLPKSRNPVWGRAKDCKKIAKILNEHSIVFLWGVAGIGKSELAKHYVKTSSNSYANIIYVPFNSSVKDSIANLHFIDDNVEDSTEKKYHNHLRHLYACDSDTILLLDNFNIAPEDDANFHELINCGCQIVVTSRNKPIDYPEFNVKELNINACMELFNYHGPGNLSNNQIKTIIEKVYAHTLLIVMIARTLKYTELEVEDILQSLEKTITETPTQTNIPITKDEKTQSVIFEKYILNLLELSNVSYEELDVLCTLAIMPVDGIQGKQLIKYTKQDSANQINHLIQLGYITGDNINESKLYVHPLIGEVAIKKHETHMASVIKDFTSSFLFCIYKDKHYPDIDEQRIAISVFEWIVSLNKIKFCYEVIDLVSLFMKSGQFYYVEEASKYVKNNVTDLGSAEVTYINALTSYYQGMADVQLNMNDSAHIHFVEASNILADLTHYSLIEAELYFNSLIEAAASITDIMQSITALENIHIIQYDLPDSTYKALIGRLNFKLGYKYLTENRFDEAKIQFNNCLQLRKELFGENSPSVGLVYGNIGYLYQAQKNYSAAAENYEQSLIILQKHLPRNHIEIIRLHTNLGITYSCLSNEPTHKLLSETHFHSAELAIEDIYFKDKSDIKYQKMAQSLKQKKLIKSQNIDFSVSDIFKGNLLIMPMKNHPVHNQPFTSPDAFDRALNGSKITIDKLFNDEES